MIVILIALFVVYSLVTRSGYMPVSISSASKFDLDSYSDSVFGLTHSMSCNPGSADEVDPKTGARGVKSAYYTSGLIPGGMCSDQQTVNDLMAYKLRDTKYSLGD
jgi:hypothetical protein